MGAARAARLFAANAVWRSTGLRSAGRVLVDALGSPDEDARTIAGILLVRAGGRSEPLLLEAAGRRECLPMALAVLGELGDPAVEPVLAGYLDDPDPEVAEAARNALEILRLARRERG